MIHLLFYCDHLEIPLRPGHKFPVTKYRLLRERLQRSGLFQLQPAPLADLDTVCLVHDRAYAEAFAEGRLEPAMVRRIGFPWSRGLVERTFASVGSTVAAAHHAMATGWGGGLAGGTHHAFRAEGAGFCIFNDVAVAIESLRADGTIRRAAILDLDVHQGDGTAAIFAADPGVLTISFHGRNNFPFRKQRSKVDVEFENGTGDAEYLARLPEALTEVERFRPEIVFYLSGVDALATDRLGKLSLTPQGMRRRDELVLDAFLGRYPLVITLGGGYSEPIDATVAAHAETFLLAAGGSLLRTSNGDAPDS